MSKELQQNKIELQEWLSKRVIALILALPIFFLGFSEMYFPKYAAPDWFVYVCALSYLISMSYFFENQTRHLLRYFYKK